MDHVDAEVSIQGERAHPLEIDRVPDTRAVEVHHPRPRPPVVVLEHVGVREGVGLVGEPFVAPGQVGRRLVAAREDQVLEHSVAQSAEGETGLIGRRGRRRGVQRGRVHGIAANFEDPGRRVDAGHVEVGHGGSGEHVLQRRDEVVGRDASHRQRRAEQRRSHTIEIVPAGPVDEADDTREEQANSNQRAAEDTVTRSH